MFQSDGVHDAIEEVVWNSVFLYGVLIRNATGGGFSAYTDIPDYQKDVPDLTPEGYINPDWFPEGSTEEEKKKLLIEKFSSKRAIPDVGGHASLAPNGFGYWVNFQNEDWLTGGTSAVAPLWSALIARINEALGKDVGFLNPSLYQLMGTDAFKPITSGNNGLLSSNTHWKAGEPWNPCTGLGVPNGENLLKHLKKLQGK